MQDLPKPTKRMLREQARAHEEELRRALLPLADAFDRWRAGEIDAFALSDLIHEFHDGESREIWKRYNYVQPYASVAYAIHTGIPKREEVPPELLDALARALAYHEEEDRVMPEPGSDSAFEE